MRFHKKNSRSLLASLLIHALWATFAHHKDVPTKSGQWVGRYNKNIGPPHDLPPLRSFVLSSIFRPSPHQSDQRIYDAPRRPVAVAPLSSNSRKAKIHRLFLPDLRYSPIPPIGTREKNWERFDSILIDSILFLDRGWGKWRKMEEGSYYSLFGLCYENKNVR